MTSVLPPSWSPDSSYQRQELFEKRLPISWRVLSQDAVDLLFTILNP